MFFEEFLLLIPVATPVAVVVVINLILAATGEVGTLLMPSRMDFPAVCGSMTDHTPASRPADRIPADAANAELAMAA